MDLGSHNPPPRQLSNTIGGLVKGVNVRLHWDKSHSPRKKIIAGLPLVSTITCVTGITLHFLRTNYTLHDNDHLFFYLVYFVFTMISPKHFPVWKVNSGLVPTPPPRMLHTLRFKPIYAILNFLDTWRMCINWTNFHNIIYVQHFPHFGND